MGDETFLENVKRKPLWLSYAHITQRWRVGGRSLGGSPVPASLGDRGSLLEAAARSPRGAVPTARARASCLGAEPAGGRAAGARTGAGGARGAAGG